MNLKFSGTYFRQMLHRAAQPLRPCLGEDGNLILALCFSIIVLVATTFSATVSGNNSMHTQTSLLNTEFNMATFQYQLISHIQNPVTWNQIVSSSSNGKLSQCFTDPAFDCPNQTNSLVLANADGSVFYDPSLATTGVTRYGTICDTYGQPDAGECLYTYSISWTPQCNALSGNCMNVPISISITLLTPTALKSKIQINGKHFAANLIVN